MAADLHMVSKYQLSPVVVPLAMNASDRPAEPASLTIFDTERAVPRGG